MLLANHFAASRRQAAHLLVAQKQSSTCEKIHQRLKCLDKKMSVRVARLGLDMERRITLHQALLRPGSGGRRLVATCRFKVLEVAMDHRTKTLLGCFDQRRKMSAALGDALEECRATLTDGIGAGTECDSLDERLCDEVLQLVILWKA